MLVQLETNDEVIKSYKVNNDKEIDFYTDKLRNIVTKYDLSNWQITLKIESKMNKIVFKPDAGDYKTGTYVLVTKRWSKIVLAEIREEKQVGRIELEGHNNLSFYKFNKIKRGKFCFSANGLEEDKFFDKIEDAIEYGNEFFGIN